MTQSAYKSPKKKIFDLKAKGYLQPIKRGQYFNLKSSFLKSTPYDVIANSLYFPSYVSMEWALQYYGLIMDRVTTVTSVTTLRSKTFTTPLAPFSYSHINKNRYPIGYLSRTNEAGDSFFIARPEKALLDYINLKTKSLVIKSEKDIHEFLEDDLRLEMTQFFDLISVKDLEEIRPSYHRNSKEHRILKWIINRKEEST